MMSLPQDQIRRRGKCIQIYGRGTFNLGRGLTEL
jgi:hypothetical protein